MTRITKVKVEAFLPPPVGTFRTVELDLWEWRLILENAERSDGPDSPSLLLKAATEAEGSVVVRSTPEAVPERDETGFVEAIFSRPFGTPKGTRIIVVNAQELKEDDGLEDDRIDRLDEKAAPRDIGAFIRRVLLFLAEREEAAGR